MIIKEPFGTLPDNTPVTAYTLSNSSILRARIIDFGGTVVNLWVKGKDGAAGAGPAQKRPGAAL